jgi:predicted protein tyrosine phosphatase
MMDESETEALYDTTDMVSEYNALGLQKKAQLIVPNLYLGPLQITENNLWLENLGIDCILSILGFDQNTEHSKSVVASTERVWICVEDRVAAEEQMRESLPKAIAQLHQWISTDNKTAYVHCQSGISRSATVAIAYLMKHCGMALMDAYRLVHDARPVINPNDGFFRALQDYAEIECLVDYTSSLSGEEEGDECDKREREISLYNAYQLISQLSFTGVTLEQATCCLERYNGDICMAANSILSQFEKAN